VHDDNELFIASARAAKSGEANNGESESEASSHGRWKK